MEEETLHALVLAAREASARSYSPYSGFSVGAAVLTAKGNVYGGTNIENASYGATVCAERVAILKAVSEGERKIVAIAVHADAAEVAVPCGMCLQVLSEFAEGDIPVILSGKGGTRPYRLSDLLPHPFNKDQL